MKYETRNLTSYHLHMIQTDKFKSILIRVILRKPVKKEEITFSNILMDMLVESTNTYKTKKELVKRTQELYAANLSGNSYRYGLFQNISLTLKILNDKYTEEGMFKESLLFLKEVLFNPNVENGSFKKDTLDYLKKDARLTIESIKEDPEKYSTIRLVETMNDNSPISYHGYGYIEDLDKITPESLYKFYQDLIATSDVDIYVIGNIDMEETYQLFKDNFEFTTFKKPKGSPIITWDSAPLKIKEKKEQDDIKQSKLAIGCRLVGLTDYEWKYPLTLYNIILGGDADSILFAKVREENSLCYTIRSSVNKVENLLFIRAGIAKENIDKAIKLIKQSLKDMIKGEFSEEDISKAKEVFQNAIKSSLEGEAQIVNLYDTMALLQTDDVETRLQKMQEVTKEDIINVAKKVKIDTIYCLEGVKESEEN